MRFAFIDVHARTFHFWLPLGGDVQRSQRHSATGCRRANWSVLNGTIAYSTALGDGSAR